MQIRHISALYAVMMLLAAVMSCSGTDLAVTNNALPGLADLPAITGLDSLRGGSASAGWPARVQEPVAAQNTSPFGAGLLLQAPADGIAYSVYRFTQPAGDLLDVQAAGSDKLWLIVADYADSRWEQAVLLQGGKAEVELAQLGDAVSPEGYVYCATVCAPQTAGVLDSIILSSDTAVTSSTYYVAPGGVDGGPGSEAAPWATLQYAADAVEAGDTVIVRPGNYNGFHLQSSGAPGALIRFLADPGVNITGDNPSTPDGINVEDWSGTGISYIEIAGFTVTDRSRTGIRVVGSDTSFAHHIVIRENICDANGTWGIFTGFVNEMLIEANTCTNSVEQHGIYFSNSGDYVTIRDNTCAHNADCGIHMNGDASMGGDGIISGALVECNTIFDNGVGGGSGINCDGVQWSTIRNNLLYGNHASGISLYCIDAAMGAQNDAVVNNTVVMAADARWCLNIADDSTGAQVFNNVLYNAHSWRGSISIAAQALPGFASDYNAVNDRFTLDDGDSVVSLAAWSAQTSQDLHSFVALPEQMFTDHAGNDYTPAATSLLRDCAFMLYAPAADIIGILRPQ